MITVVVNIVAYGNYLTNLIIGEFNLNRKVLINKMSIRYDTPELKNGILC